MNRMIKRPREHMALSAALALGAAGLLFFILVWPALSARAAFHERLELLQVRQQKFTAAAARAPALEKELEALAGVKADQGGFLEEKPRALAAADLQQLLGSLIEQSGGSLVSTQVLEEINNDSVFPEITVKVYLRGATEVLQKLMYRLEINRPLLLPDNLLVQKRQQGDAGGGRDADELEIRFDVTAFIYQSQSDAP